MNFRMRLIGPISAVVFLFAMPSASANEEVVTEVATVRIFAYGTGGTSGHSFLLVTNISASTRTVGVRAVSAGGTITVGTWGNKADGKGVYYNLERYFGSGSYPGRVSLTATIDSTQLSTLNSSIQNNNSWSLTNNCSSFTERAWNSFAGTKVSAGTLDTPTNLANSIKSKSGFATNAAFTSTTLSNVFRQVGTSSSKLVTSTAGGGGSSS